MNLSETSTLKSHINNSSKEFNGYHSVAIDANVKNTTLLQITQQYELPNFTNRKFIKSKSKSQFSKSKFPGGAAIRQSWIFELAPIITCKSLIFGNKYVDNTRAPKNSHWIDFIFIFWHNVGNIILCHNDIRYVC